MIHPYETADAAYCRGHSPCRLGLWRVVEWEKNTVISYGELQRVKIDHDYVSGTFRRTTLSQGKTALNVHST